MGKTKRPQRRLLDNTESKGLVCEASADKNVEQPVFAFKGLKTNVALEAEKLYDPFVQLVAQWYPMESVSVLRLLFSFPIKTTGSFFNSQHHYPYLATSSTN